MEPPWGVCLRPWAEKPTQPGMGLGGLEVATGLPWNWSEGFPGLVLTETLLAILPAPVPFPHFLSETWLRIQSRVLGHRPIPRVSSWTYCWQLFIPAKHHSSVYTGLPCPPPHLQHQVRISVLA